MSLFIDYKKLNDGKLRISSVASPLIVSIAMLTGVESNLTGASVTISGTVTTPPSISYSGDDVTVTGTGSIDNMNTSSFGTRVRSSSTLTNDGYILNQNSIGGASFGTLVQSSEFTNNAYLKNDNTAGRGTFATNVSKIYNSASATIVNSNMGSSTRGMNFQLEAQLYNSGLIRNSNSGNGAAGLNFASAGSTVGPNTLANDAMGIIYNENSSSNSRGIYSSGSSAYGYNVVDNAGKIYNTNSDASQGMRLRRVDITNSGSIYNQNSGASSDGTYLYAGLFSNNSNIHNENSGASSEGTALGNLAVLKNTGTIYNNNTDGFGISVGFNATLENNNGVIDNSGATGDAVRLGSASAVFDNNFGSRLITGVNQVTGNGSFNWNGGTLDILGVLDVGGGSLIEGTVNGASVTSLHELISDTQIILGVGASLSLDGGRMETPNLALFGGSLSLNSGDIDDVDFIQIASNSTLTLATGSIPTIEGEVFVGADGTLDGFGTVKGRVAGTAGGKIAATTGDLNLGDSSSGVGFGFDGELEAGSHTISVLDANQAELGFLTTINGGSIFANSDFMSGGTSGGTLQDGVRLDSGKTITGNGFIQSDVDLGMGGSIVGDSLDSISMSGALSGNGLVANLRLVGGQINPGLGIGAITIADTTVSGGGGVINWEIFGDTPALFDQLILQGNVLFIGTTINFHFGSFVPSGQTFQIFDLTGLTSVFNPDAFNLNNVPAGYFLNATGALTQVPEPGTYLTLASALAVSLGARRRKLSKQV